MIPGDRNFEPAVSPTLDDLFCRAALRRPDAIALCDPPNRADFTDGAPRRLSYAEADRAIGALAARLRRLGLPAGTVVGVALPNSVESVLTMLAVLRAGMIAAPLPVLWRGAEMVKALDRIGAKIIVTCSRIGDFDSCGLAMQAAAELFPIRHVCAFGTGLPDGVIALDEPAAATAEDHAAFEPASALDIALVSFDVTPEGTVPVARNHAQWIAAGLVVMLEPGLGPRATILGSCALSSFSGIALQMMPWLLSGGTLSLHHAFDAGAFAAQCRDGAFDTMVVPGPLLPTLAAAGLLDHPELRNVIAAWRAPERLGTSPAWQHPRAGLTDMAVFGEIGIVALRRDRDGHPVPMGSGELRAPRGSAQAAGLLELVRTDAGTLALRGAMVPRQPFPPGAERLSLPCWRTAETGFVDTGYACRQNPATGAIQVTAPPPGLVSVGGYRLDRGELERQVRQAAGGVDIAILPDAIAGHRLAGIADDAEAARTALAAHGANGLVVGAFRDRSPPRTA
jgi:hypothetical protein